MNIMFFVHKLINKLADLDFTDTKRPTRALVLIDSSVLLSWNKVEEASDSNKGWKLVKGGTRVHVACCSATMTTPASECCAVTSDCGGIFSILMKNTLVTWTGVSAIAA